MIITCKKEIPSRWIIFAVLPSAAFAYTLGSVGTAFIFSLKKFLDHPAGLTLILSLPTAISMIAGPCVNFISDRIWTRLGRRKPFIVASWSGMILSMALMPLMPNFWALLAVYMLYCLCCDLNSPMEALSQEIIPPHERGRATGIMQWLNNFAGIIFYFVALGRFDDVRFMAGVPIVGETVIYWISGLALLVLLLLITLGIKEMDQQSPLKGERLSLRSFVGGLSDRELWPVFLLVFGSAVLAAGLGPLGNLLYTDQWNYTKQDMGINVAVGGVLNMFIIGLLTLFADKLNRMKAYRTLICISVALNFAYFCYVTYLLPDQRPSLVEIITFGETGSIIGILTNMVYLPLVYDYIRRNKMGTYGAGSVIIQKLTALITLNGVGLFIWAFAVLFQPAAGEMARVVLKNEAPKAEVQSFLRSKTWSSSNDEPSFTSKSIEANAWQANGVVSQKGCSWEVRLRDNSSEKLAKERELLLKKKSAAVTQEKSKRDQIRVKAGNTEADSALQKSVQDLAREIQVLSQQIEGIDRTLEQRSKDFEQQVTRTLSSRMIADGDQILDWQVKEALEIELPLADRPGPRDMNSSLNKLRSELPGFIDMRPVKTEAGYRILASILTNPGADNAQQAESARMKIATAFGKRRAELFDGSNPDGVPIFKIHRALAMDLMTIESPLDDYVSPIHRIVNLFLGLFDAIPRPDRKLNAMAHGLRTPGKIDHVRVSPGPTSRSIRVLAVLPEGASFGPSPADPITARIRMLTGPSAEEPCIDQARGFYDLVEKAAHAQRLTICRPVVASGYVPMKYNYMCGYLWMLFMGSIGIAITLYFSHLEKRGYIQKRGVEEAEAAS